MPYTQTGLVTQLSDASLNTVTQVDWFSDEADQQTAEIAHHAKSSSKQKPMQKGGHKWMLGVGGSSNK